MSRKSKQAAYRRKKRIQLIQRAAMIVAALAICVGVYYVVTNLNSDVVAPPAVTPEPTVSVQPTVKPTAKPTVAPTPEPTPLPTPINITISAAGDCTLGGDMKGASEKRFYKMLTQSGEPDNTYCFKNVLSIFEADDLTIVNLEGVLTKSTKYNKSDKSKKYIMRGLPGYAQMLPASSIEIANIANNHMTDFGDAGIEETTGYLDEQGVAYCGYGRTTIQEVKGVKIGFVGFNTWTTKDEEIEKTMKEVRENCDILIASFHWGSELKYEATEKQVRYAHMAVDLGADLVLGHHPHVIGGIEVYKGVNIVYSLGNFCFGGKENPKDKDTFIYQHTFTVENGELTGGKANIIPCKITSVANEKSNNYQPTPATGEKAEKILKKILKYSKSFDDYLDVVALMQESAADIADTQTGDAEDTQKATEGAAKDDAEDATTDTENGEDAEDSYTGADPYAEDAGATA